MRVPDPFRSLGELAGRLGAEHPEDTAFRAGGRTYARGEIAYRSRLLAVTWPARGLVPGDVVGIVGDGGPVLALALFSTAMAGLVPLLLDSRLTSDEARTVFERARPRALALCTAADPPWAAELPRQVFTGEEQSHGGEPPSLPSDPDAPAVLLVTSGTSGRPRVVPLSAANLSSNIRAGCEVHPCGRGEVFLSILPATHAFELTTGLLGPLVCGASVVVPGSRNPRRLLDEMATGRVTRINVVPAILGMMAAELRDSEGAREILKALGGSLHSIVCGGAAIDPDLARLAVAHHLPLWVGYGLTEASPIVALGRAESSPVGSTGRPLPGVQVRIDGETGEVQVRGPNVTKGYVGDETATTALFQDGWLRTGDLGRLDADGFLFILGRRREMIVTAAGLKLSPEAIEAAYRSPRFADVCAVGVPDRAGGGGEKPQLAVVPSPDEGVGGDVLRAEFARLSGMAGDRRAFAMTVFSRAFPRTGTLKLRRDLVRQAVIAREGVIA